MCTFSPVICYRVVFVVCFGVFSLPNEHEMQNYRIVIVVRYENGLLFLIMMMIAATTMLGYEKRNKNLVFTNIYTNKNTHAHAYTLHAITIEDDDDVGGK